MCAEHAHESTEENQSLIRDAALQRTKYEGRTVNNTKHHKTDRFHTAAILYFEVYVTEFSKPRLLEIYHPVQTPAVI